MYILLLTERLSVCNDIIDQVGAPVVFGFFTLSELVEYYVCFNPGPVLGTEW